MIMYAEVECVIYDTQSLKQKRSILKSMIVKLRKDFNVTVAELDYHDLWQRTKIGIVTISNERKMAEKIIQEALKTIDQNTELERTITNVNRI
ncbi:DUF503 domain-containing protein [Virgibacillus sp. W0181]|uniref:DUF503 domain-containing protein n=1 Tax=Virgibacillus sp. W0181 TaxID=3391581 RepID=UPI003F489423